MSVLIQKTNIIEIINLKKHFKEIKAVDGISLEIPRGELYSILGPNGAGKTTLVKMLTTILTPTDGDANIDNFSIKKQKENIVKIIGVCPQDVVIYDVLTAEENVEFVARMNGIPKEEAHLKAIELLEKFGIAGKQMWAKKFSGGMKRRLNLAMSLVHEPKILFLDEPTAGLDPQARRLVWDFISDLKQKDITIILMTHDMVEADSLSDHIAIIDQGKLIAQGTPMELKEKYGSDNVLEIITFKEEEMELLEKQINLKNMPFIADCKAIGKRKLLIAFQGGLRNLEHILSLIIENIEEVENMKFRQNSLEDVFLNLTGRRLRDK
ncbi:MAG: ATP-binding cassette domain-containing protein [Candidatus Lokiarchaeota archaeon]|nr:ATP-binding cassette domain-containing protein [Candidatus Lokiarchaeota archaeon]